MIDQKVLVMNRPKVCIFDVDGVLTDGTFYYSAEGKIMKKFGPDDNDALYFLKAYMKIQFISGDKKGFPISSKRIVDDMGMNLELVNPIHRMEWIKKNYNPNDVVYMGDGIFDYLVMKNVRYAIAPSNADISAQRCADYITTRKGGDRAVAEACMHILDVFFNVSLDEILIRI